jgi:DNA-binding response OmpR family regulator
VCLTAFTEKFIEVNARESGMSDFITKPISLARLKKILIKCQLIGLDDLAE